MEDTERAACLGFDIEEFDTSVATAFGEGKGGEGGEKKEKEKKEGEEKEEKGGSERKDEGKGKKEIGTCNDMAVMLFTPRNIKKTVECIKRSDLGHLLQEKKRKKKKKGRNE